MIINQLSPVTPEKLLTWEEFWDKFGGIVLGSSLIAGGLLGAWATKKYFKKENQVYGYVGSVALGGFGAYKIYTVLKKEEVGDPATPNLIFPLAITNPDPPGEEWSTLFYHTIRYQIINSYNTKYRVYAGMSLIHAETGQVYDAPIIPGDIDANGVAEVRWRVGAYFGKGLYWIVASVWDVVPEGDCELQGTCHRLGETDSYFYFTFFGI